MKTSTIEYRELPGTAAAIGRAGSHTVVADRPPGVAGGMGLGFNGGQLLGLALGACFSNDLRQFADDLGEAIANFQLVVTLTLDGEPLVITHADLKVTCELESGGDPSPIIERARQQCTVANSLRAGLSVTLA